MKMKKYLLLFTISLLFFSCDSEKKKKAKIYCAADWLVVNAKTDKAAQLAFEACVERRSR